MMYHDKSQHGSSGAAYRRIDAIASAGVSLEVRVVISSMNYFPMPDASEHLTEELDIRGSVSFEKINPNSDLIN